MGKDNKEKCGFIIYRDNILTIAVLFHKAYIINIKTFLVNNYTLQFVAKLIKIKNECSAFLFVFFLFEMDLSMQATHIYEGELLFPDYSLQMKIQ